MHFCCPRPVTILHVLYQFKRSCDTIEVSKEKTLWSISNFIKQVSQASFNSLLVHVGGSRGAFAQPRNDGNKDGTYVGAVNHILKFYVTDANAAKTVLWIDKLVRAAIETAVKFADAAHLKTVRCGSAYFNESMKKAFIDGMILTICSNVW